MPVVCHFSLGISLQPFRSIEVNVFIRLVFSKELLLNLIQAYEYMKQRIHFVNRY